MLTLVAIAVMPSTNPPDRSICKPTRFRPRATESPDEIVSCTMSAAISSFTIFVIAALLTPINDASSVRSIPDLS